MRIIINIDEAKDANGKRNIRVRTGYYFSGSDKLRVMNCGVEIYDIIKDGFGNGFEGGTIIHEGEKK
jgi:hypothetical protein